ncbi:hypothetical protein HNY73_021921 [Argiope bruennichi]|uniref:Uncharacterized protein n=1 Tax=Argiope bruennichi TaxID=94029 RepID=A0A8T0E0M0_ARGBR|nr:hypothetical protein HNY73_021921 [Argiope bruennichi]
MTPQSDRFALFASALGIASPQRSHLSNPLTLLMCGVNVIFLEAYRIFGEIFDIRFDNGFVSHVHEIPFSNIEPLPSHATNILSNGFVPVLNRKTLRRKHFGITLSLNRRFQMLSKEINVRRKKINPGDPKSPAHDSPLVSRNAENPAVYAQRTA